MEAPKIRMLNPNEVTLHIKVDIRELRIRTAIGLRLIKIGCRIIGLGIRIEPLGPSVDPDAPIPWPPNVGRPAVKRYTEPKDPLKIPISEDGFERLCRGEWVEIHDTWLGRSAILGLMNGWKSWIPSASERASKASAGAQSSARTNAPAR